MFLKDKNIKISIPKPVQVLDEEGKFVGDLEESELDGAELLCMYEEQTIFLYLILRYFPQ